MIAAAWRPPTRRRARIRHERSKLDVANDRRVVGIRTLRHWRAHFDEAHFVGSHEKAPLLRAPSAHIYFDDRGATVNEANRFVPVGLVHSNPMSRGYADRYSRQTRFITPSAYAVRVGTSLAEMAMLTLLSVYVLRFQG